MPDPANPQALNRYSYVYNNPLNFIDPTGYFSDDAIKNYLQRTYGEQWEDIYSQWRANEAWWTMLLEAQPGDILVMTSDQEQDSYGLILGDIAGQGIEDDVLWGIAPIRGIPRAFEEFDIGEPQDIGSWLDREVKALARLETERAFVRYWEPPRYWGKPYVNVPLVWRPEPGQTLHPFTRWPAALLFVAGAESLDVTVAALEASAEVPEAVLVTVPTALITFGAGAWLFANAYNLAVVPVSSH